MKSKFSKTWNASKQPRKQVKFRANAPNHIKRKFMSSTLDKTLREKYERRNIEVIKEDEVKIMRGKFRGKQGKVGKVDVKNTRVQIEGVQRSKAGGEKIETWFHPSVLKVIVLNDKDKRRLKKMKKEASKEVTPTPKESPNREKKSKTGKINEESKEKKE